MHTQFKKDIDAGLSDEKKNLSSKYFYDKKGDALFMQIMAMPEYYLTRAELEIFTQQSDRMISSLKLQKENYFELIELGAGDGTKTKELLKVLIEEGYQFDYMPIDISENVLGHLKNTMQKELPSLSVKPQQGDYFECLHNLQDSHHPKVVLFLGSNIGNMSDQQAADFIYKLGRELSVGDKLMVGVDLIKSADIVLPAYDDAAGITEQFNLNLLHRINNELDADFNIDKFTHAPEYTEDEGVARSYLQSTVSQTVTINDLDKQYEFDAGEKIHMEISRKYSEKILQKIIEFTDFNITENLKDSRNYFSDFILERS